MKTFENIHNLIISPKSLFIAWKRFSRDKRKKKDILQFEWHLEQNIFALHRELKNQTYTHGPYSDFYVRDPKVRHIHKATVRDRVVHHAVFHILNIIFEPIFIPTSFSCRIGKGTHKGVEKAADMMRAVSRNYTRPCFVLKCDVRKFFDSVDHVILASLLQRKIKDTQAMNLLEEIIGSYSTDTGVFTRERERERERVKHCRFSAVKEYLLAI